MGDKEKSFKTQKRLMSLMKQHSLDTDVHNTTEKLRQQVQTYTVQNKQNSSTKKM